MASDDDLNAYRLGHRNKVIQPLNSSVRPDPTPHQTLAQQSTTEPEGDPAIDLIRKKLNDLYDKEPNAKEEKQEVEHITHRSKHQQFMYSLSQSGKSLAEIQTEWHNYYTNLPDAEKHEVWHEFYALHGQNAAPPQLLPTKQAPKSEEPTEVQHAKAEPEESPKAKPEPTHRRKTHRRAASHPLDTRTVSEVKHQLVGKVAARSKRKSTAHLQSLMFGMSMGIVVILVLLFGFFNERFIAPFITPSRAVSSTPIIIDPNSTAVGTEPKVIIPKINVEIPVVYDEPSIKEDKIQAGLERGVVHYATTPSPGEKGNAVIFGHSANNILNRGKYKFAFVLLKRLELGDTFFLHKDGKRYVYKVFDKKIVPPTDLSVLNPIEGKVATATLITCDPPGTNLNRLVVVAEQISPDPITNGASTAKQDTATATTPLPGNSPSLWSRIQEWFN